ncbi:jg11380 [Pararge aegeria aegeria]|uniref:Jg11380 protein n=1 Tax=Pararge aegeria aegeria TaxID=348720 RepID=A0A8S4RLQ2_9NEOP|nr:jg11380 [Pararge aegeria aegeria]
MISGGWVCALHVRTAGLGGAALGSDEEEAVYLAYVVIDVLTNQEDYGHRKEIKVILIPQKRDHTVCNSD